MVPPTGYVAYIDEAGDDGLQRFKPADPTGASEWMVLSCLLIKAEREAEVLPWLKSLIESFNQHQITHLHFRQLRGDKRLQACEYIAKLPVRLFAVTSNKRNMKNYHNSPAAKAKINVTAWFYVWLARVLVERVTDYCSRRTKKDYQESRPIRFEFASRGGVKIGDAARYLAYLKDQDEFGLLYNTYWKPCWDVMDFAQINTYPAKNRAGLQLADSVASAFYSALELTAEGQVKPEPAKALMPRMAMSRNNRIYDFGLKVWPDFASTIIQANQREILDYYRFR